jgi:hypothetical protein
LNIVNLPKCVGKGLCVLKKIAGIVLGFENNIYPCKSDETHCNVYLFERFEKKKQKKLTPLSNVLKGYAKSPKYVYKRTWPSLLA